MSKQFDVFLSHNSREKPLLNRVAAKLKREGIEPWFDDWCLTAGGAWGAELEQGLRASKAYAVFVGEHGIGDWERLEFNVAMDRLAKEPDFRAFYVLLPGLGDPFDPTTLPVFLRAARSWVDLRKGLEDSRVFQNLINAIKGVARGTQVLVETRDNTCPYQGLRTFDEEHAKFFFGRNADTQRLIEKLKGPRFLAVIGASGSGKSSVVRAGLIPALRDQALPNSHSWIVQVLRPGGRPIEELATRIVKLTSLTKLGATLDELANDPRALHLYSELALVQRPASGLLWVIDQFEEVFTRCREEQERDRFISSLLYAASVPDGNTRVILTMRADFYPKCSAYAQFADHLAQHQYVVGPIDSEGLREVIVEPAGAVGLQFEEGLVDTILGDVANQPGALPLLEHALLELWERRHGIELTLDAYRESGGVHGAIAKRADAIYEAFEPAEKEIVRRVMLRLTEPGEGTEDTRRRVRREELAPKQDSGEALDRVVNDLTTARLLTISASEQEGELIDVSHEALIRGWPKLREWIDEDRAGLRVQRRLTEAAQEWERLNYDEDVLYRGARLIEAHEYANRHQQDLNGLELQFLEAGLVLRDQVEQARVDQLKREEDQRQRELAYARALTEAQKKRVRQAVGLAVVASSLAIVATVFFYKERNASELANRELARNYWSRGVDERDRNGDKMKASHYFMTVAEMVDPGQAPNVRLASAFLDGNLRLLNISKAISFKYYEVSPDGERVLAWNSDGSVWTWEAKHGDWTRVIKLTFELEGATFSHNQKTMVAWGKAGKAQVWDLSRKQAIAEIVSDGVMIGAIFSRGDAQIATWTESGVWQVWGSQTGQERLPRLSSKLQDLTFNPEFIDDHRILLPQTDSIAIWDTTRDGSLSSIATGAQLDSMKLSQDSSRLLTLSNREAIVWNTRDFTPMAKFSTAQSGDSGSFSPDGKRVVIWSRDGRVMHWDYEANVLPLPLPTLNTTVNGAAFSPDSKEIITWSSDGKVQKWDNKSTAMQVIATHTDEVLGVEFDKNGKRILVRDSSGTFQVWAYDIRQPVTPAIMFGSNVLARFGPDGASLISLTTDGVGRLWSIQANGPVALPMMHNDPVEQATFRQGNPEQGNPDIVTLTRKGELQVWDIAGNSLCKNQCRDLGTLPGNREISSDGKRVLAWTDRNLSVLDVMRADAPVQFAHPETIKGAIFCSDSGHVITWGERNIVRMWNIDERRMVLELPAFKGSVDGAIVNRDQTHIFVWTSEGEVSVWAIGGKGGFNELARYKVETAIKGAVFGYDGSRILFWISGGKLYEWKYQGQKEPPVQLAIELPVNGARYGPKDQSILIWTEKTPLVFDRKRLVTLGSRHKNNVLGGMFNADESWVMTWSEDTAQVSDTTDGKLLTSSLAHEGSLNGAIAIASPDGQYILTWGEDKSARLWNLQIPKPWLNDKLSLRARHEAWVGYRLTASDEREFLGRQDWLTSLAGKVSQ